MTDTNSFPNVNLERFKKFREPLCSNNSDHLRICMVTSRICIIANDEWKVGERAFCVSIQKEDNFSGRQTMVCSIRASCQPDEGTDAELWSDLLYILGIFTSLDHGYADRMMQESKLI